MLVTLYLAQKMEAKFNYKVLFCWICLCISSFVDITESSNSYEIADFDSDEQIKTSDCRLVPEIKRMQLKLDKLINGNNRLIKLNIAISWNLTRPNETYLANVSWFITTDASGQNLLMLDDHFEVMSLGTLSYGIAAMEISFLQIPEYCLDKMNSSEVESLIQFSLLTLANISKPTDEDKSSVLHICKKSLDTLLIECCDPTLSRDHVSCFLFEIDTWFSNFRLILALLAVVMFLRCIYFIPLSVYEEDKSKYSLLNMPDGGFDIKLKIKNKLFPKQETSREFLPSEYNEDWVKVAYDERHNDTFLNTFRNKLDMDQMAIQRENFIYTFKVKLASVTKKDDELVSEAKQSFQMSQSIFRTFSDIFLNCKIRYADAFRRNCNNTDFESIPWSVCIRKITKCFIIALCLVPFSLRIAISFRYNDIKLFHGRWVAITTVVIMFCIMFFFSVVLESDKGFRKRIKEPFVNTLRILNKKNVEEKFKMFIDITLSPLRLRWCQCCRWLKFINPILLPFTLVIGTIVLCWHSLPMIQFLGILYRQIIKTIQKHLEITSIEVTMIKYIVPLFMLIIVLGYIAFVFTVSLFIDTVLFYLQCFAYILIGILLNFDSVFNTVLLILIVLRYAFDCLSRAYKTVNDFNYRLIKVIYELIVASSTDGEGRLFERVQTENKNIMTRLNILLQAEKQFIGIVADGEGKLCFSTTGLLIYYKIQNSENLPFIHIPESFLDELALKRGQLTPGSKYKLLFEACKEIASMLLAILSIFLVFSEFGRENDISAGVNTIVSVGSSAALVMLNKLLFVTADYSLNDNDVHLTALVQRHAKNFKDLWTKADFEILHFDVHSENDSCTVGSVNRQPDENSDEDCDIIVELCENEQRPNTESWYVRSFYRKEQPEVLTERLNSSGMYKSFHRRRRSYDEI